MSFLKGKRVLITGIANNRSIAYGIAKMMKEQGAKLALTYFTEKLQSRVEKAALDLECDIVLPCDASSDESINDLFSQLKKYWDSFDIIIHSMAFAPADHLEGSYMDHVTREGFLKAHDISVYTLTALAKAARPMLNQGGAILTLSYLGAEGVVPNYNVMGIAKASLEASVKYMAESLGRDAIRVNAISAGPIRTLAASGIKNFRKLLDASEAITPLHKTVTIEEVGNAAAFLCSDLASGITGEILHVDGGMHCLAVAGFEG